MYHIPGGGPTTRFPIALAGQPPFSYAPRHDLTSDVKLPVPKPPGREAQRFSGQSGGAARRGVVYGAGGPLAAATTEALAHDHVLRLTDVRPNAEIVSSPTGSGTPTAVVCDRRCLGIGLQ